LLHAWAVLLSIGPHALAIMTSGRLNGTRNRIMAVGALARIRAYRFLVAHRAVLLAREVRRSPLIL
jgi:hypothetical protein